MAEDDKWNLNWWRRAPTQMRALAATLIAFATSLTASVAAWPVVEPYMYAHRGYVREQVENETAKLRREFYPTTSGMYEIQISIARSRRSTLNSDIAKMEIDAPKSDSTTELLARRAQIERLKEEKSLVDDEIRKLTLAREKI